MKCNSYAQENEYTFSLYTQDGENYKPIEGTKFVITDLDENPVKGIDGEIIGNLEIINGKEQYTLTSDESGYIRANIPKGSYKAIEVKANERYKFEEDENNRTYYFSIESQTKTCENEWIQDVKGYLWNSMVSVVGTKEGNIVSVGTIMEYSDNITGKNYDGVDLNGDGVIDETSSGDNDGIIVSYDKNGNLLWSETFGGIYDDKFEKIIKTQDEGYVIIGQTSSPVVYLNGSMIQELSRENYDTKGKDGFILKVNSEGKYEWAVRIGGNLDDKITDISESENGDLYIIGDYESEKMNFYDYNVKKSIKGFVKNIGEQNMFVAKYTSKGEFLWCKEISGNDYIEACKIEWYSEGITLAFNYIGSVNFKDKVYQGESLEEMKGMIIRMSLDGDFVWNYDICAIAKNWYDTKNYVKISSIAVSKENEIIVATNCTGKIQAREYAQDEYNDIFTNEYSGICVNIIKLSENGKFVKNIYNMQTDGGSSKNAIVIKNTDIKWTSDDNIIMSGYYCISKTIDVDRDGNTSGNLDFVESSTTSPNGYFIKMNKDGKVEFSDCLYKNERIGSNIGYVNSVCEINGEKIVAVGSYEWKTCTTRNYYEKYSQEKYTTNIKGNLNSFIIYENYQREDEEFLIPCEIIVNNYKKETISPEDYYELPVTGSKERTIIMYLSISLIYIGLYLINYATYKNRKGEV